MILKFKKNSDSTAAFAKWLAGFKTICPSLLLEIDIDKQEFAAKCFPKDKSVVKYSRISFEDAGYAVEFLRDDEGNDINWAEHSTETDGRIKFGIYDILGKAIDVVNMFSGVDHELAIQFVLDENVVYNGSQKGESVYRGKVATFRMLSGSLTMNILGSDITEVFQKCDDDIFINRVCAINNPVKFRVGSDVLNDLGSIAQVLSTDKGRDRMRFYSKENDGKTALYVLDAIENKYDYLLGYLVEGEAGTISTIVKNEKFLGATKNLAGEEYDITFDTAGASKLVIDTKDSKIVVAAVRKEEI